MELYEFLKEFKSTEAAAWVQAVGSIVAIFIAILVSCIQAWITLAAVRREHENSVQRDKINREESLMIALSTLFFVLVDARDTIFTVQKQPNMFLRTGINQMMISSSDAMKKFPSYEFPIANLTPYIVQCPHILLAFGARWEDAKNTDPDKLLNDIVNKNDVGKLPDEIIKLFDKTINLIINEFNKRNYPMPIWKSQSE